jgi:hypothetical protein
MLDEKHADKEALQFPSQLKNVEVCTGAAVGSLAQLHSAFDVWV